MDPIVENIVPQKFIMKNENVEKLNLDLKNHVKKKCRRCNQIKDICEFRIQTSTGERHYICTTCLLTQRAHSEKHYEKKKRIFHSLKKGKVHRVDNQLQKMCKTCLMDLPLTDFKIYDIPIEKTEQVFTESVNCLNCLKKKHASKQKTMVKKYGF